MLYRGSEEAPGCPAFSTELPEVLPPSGPVHQQVRSVHPQVCGLQRSSSCGLPAEARRAPPVSPHTCWGCPVAPLGPPGSPLLPTASLCTGSRPSFLPCCCSLPGTLPHLPSSKVNPCFLRSDLSFDNSDLVMLKSLLAGLNLPSRDGRTDEGLDEDGEGNRTGELSGGVQEGPGGCSWALRPHLPHACTWAVGALT